MTRGHPIAPAAFMDALYARMTDPLDGSEPYLDGVSLHAIEIRLWRDGANVKRASSRWASTPSALFISSLGLFPEHHSDDVLPPEKFEGTGVFFGVAPRRNGIPSAENPSPGSAACVDVLPALFSDFDAKTIEGGKPGALALIRSLELQPSAIVDSGNGFHAYWFLDEPVSGEEDLDLAERTMRGMAESWGADAASTDRARVLRFPGTWNLKDRRRPLRCSVISLHEDRRFDLSDFEHLAAAASRQTPASPGTRLPTRIESGHRNNTLFRLGASMRRYGAELPEIEAALSVANRARCDPPLPDSEIARIAKSATRYHPADQRPLAVPESIGSTESRITFTTLRELRASPPEMPEQIVGDGLLIAGTLAMLSGPPKAMKTWLVDNLALSVAAGIPFLGFPVPKPRPVVVISLEGGIALAYDRLEKIARGLGLGEDVLDRVHVWDQRESDWPSLDEPEYVRSLVEPIQGIGAGLVLVDPIIEAHSSDENSTADMARLVRHGLRPVAERTGAGTLLAHHTNKAAAQAGRPDPSGARGSSVLYGAVASAIAVDPKSVKVGGESHDGVRMTFRLRHAETPADRLVYLNPETHVMTSAGDVPAGGVQYSAEDFRSFVADHPGCTREEVTKGLGCSLATVDRLRERSTDWLVEKNLPGRNKLAFWIDRGPDEGTSS